MGMKSRMKPLAAVVVVIALLAMLAIHARGSRGTETAYPGKHFTGPGATDGTPQSWITNHQLRTEYEQEQSELRAEVIKRRRLYQDGEVSKAEVQEAERSLVTVLVRIQEVRRSMIESEIAIAEAEMSDDSLRTPRDINNGFHHRGGANWSLKDARDLEKYFYQTFGHHLPVSALGQTATHDRMRFDHRDAMDVALHPDSREGKALIEQLRRSGIPFIAFRNAAAGSSTGAHIHIGKPSHRIASSK
jgi:hypothetical protein